jgi:hypothetical protein
MDGDLVHSKDGLPAKQIYRQKVNEWGLDLRQHATTHIKKSETTL